MADLEFEKAKAYLQEISPNGKGSIYDHLSSVLLKLIQEKPDKPLEIFETLSASVKDSQLEPEGLRESQPLFEDQADRDQLVDYIEKVRLLFRKKPKEVSEDAEEEEEPEPEEEPELCHIPDIQNDAAMFQWAGINFGPEDTLKLYLAIRQLCKENDGFDSVRFFGCISGTQADYFIVEAKLKEYPEAPESDDPDDRTEAPGQGANEFVYFVTNKLVGPQWTQLADVKPEHIKISRNVRRFFTGSLDGPVSGHPRFPWSEAVYLRAVISRICCTTVLSPAGYFTLNEEEDDSTELLQAEEYEAPLGSGMCSPETWVHRARHLLMQGRVVKYAPPEKDEEEEEPEEEAPKSPEDEEEPLPMLRSIAEDTFSGGQCWSFRVAPHKSMPDAVGIAQSQIWPGAISVAKNFGGQLMFSNVYVGTGMKYLGSAYTPPAPPALAHEFPEFPPKEEDEEPPEDGEEPAAPVSILTEQDDPLPPPEQPADEQEDGAEKAEDGEDFE